MVTARSSILSATCLVAALAIAPAAQAADLASASASISGLSFRLIDLDTNDGIAPSLTFATLEGTVVFNEANAEWSDERLTWDGGWLPLTPASFVSPSGASSAQWGPDGISGTIRSVAPSTITEAHTNAGPGTSGLFLSVGNAFSYDPDTGETLYSLFKLSANTLLELRGTFNGQLSADAQGGLVDLLPQIRPVDMLSASASSRLAASITLQAGRALDPVRGLTGYNNDYEMQSSEFRRSGDLFVSWSANSPDATEGSATAAASWSETFALAVANTRDQEIDAGLALDISLDTSGTTYLYPGYNGGGGGTVPIPEPSTWAMMALGLAGLGWARRPHAARR